MQPYRVDVKYGKTVWFETLDEALAHISQQIYLGYKQEEISLTGPIEFRIEIRTVAVSRGE